ncbi:MAG: hypothetical protein JWR72_1701 [Flavisolibacter sp.]|jgi:hypothetical protein|nr:hypothetical protein [Flavisolibacter sp.]
MELQYVNFYAVHLGKSRFTKEGEKEHIFQ